MSHTIEDHHEQKKAVQKKNRFHQEFFNMLRLRRLEDKRVADIQQSMKPKTQEREEEVGDKVASIRNRLTNQKRISNERWNRFAGTSGGGGRGL